MEFSSTETATLGHLLFGELLQPPPSESEWRTLLEGIAARNPAALYALSARIHGIVFTFMLKMSGQWAIAERLALGTFYDVWRRAAKYEPDATSAIGWILNEARSRAAARARVQARAKKRR